MKITEHKKEYMAASQEEKGFILGRVYGLNKGEDFWKHKQSGKWIIGKGGTEKIAAIEDIKVEINVEHISREFVCLSGIASWPGGGADGRSYGERVFASAHGGNCKLDYYPEMTEKRLKQRCVKDATLRDVGGAGTLFYGEDEFDGAQENEQNTQPDNKSKPAGNKSKANEPTVGELASALNAATSMTEVKGIWAQVEKMSMSDDDRAYLTDLGSKAKKRIQETDAA
jgi:hypothetical protein